MSAIGFKKMALLSFFVLSISCQSKKTNDTENAENPPGNEVQPGSDRDANGCIPSAGYLYSIVREGCIRPWEEGTPFEIYQPEKARQQPQTVFVVLSEDKSLAEIIWGGTDKPAILERRNVEEGETEPTFYESKSEQVKIMFRKHLFWIYIQDQPMYYNRGSGEGGFNARIYEQYP